MVRARLALGLEAAIGGRSSGRPSEIIPEGLNELNSWRVANTGAPGSVVIRKVGAGVFASSPATYSARSASERTMDRLFGKPKEKAPRPTLQDASATMEARGERQDDRIMKLDKELARYTQQLKTMKPGPAKQQVQKRAMAILKQKKMYENQREQTRNQQFNMDQVMFAQESLAETANTVSAMKDANKALKKQFKAIDINQVEDMQDDMADLLEQAEEIQSAMGRSYNTDDIDEARRILAE